jgi:hypothetical protein
MDGPSYFARLTFDEVARCAVAAERLFQQDPYAVAARTAAGWARLADLMERADAAVVADLGAEAAGEWETELGFSLDARAAEGRWPRDRATVKRGQPPRERQ